MRAAFHVLCKLVESSLRICFIPSHRRNVEDGHLLLEWVDIDVNDLGVSGRFALCGNPGDVAVNYEDDVCAWYKIMNTVT